MKKTIFCLILITVISFLALPPGYAYWIWTPKTGRWTSPKYSVKPNPKEQLKFSLEFYEQGKYKETIDECRKLIKRYPRAYEAAEGQFYIGSSLEKLNKPWDSA